MNDVDVVGVVEGQKGALDHVAVADGSGDEVSEARGGREEGDGSGLELRLDEDGGIRVGGGVGGEGEKRRGGRGGEGCEED